LFDVASKSATLPIVDRLGRGNQDRFDVVQNVRDIWMGGGYLFA